ncbi:MAG: ASKHA domain-containing protein, partial [Methanoregula sp.]|nr:ASKHA domain-containing protein [Methanoregula sp.]
AYTDIKNATRFGILPEFPHAEVHAIGNGSLSGAYATLVSTKYRAAAENAARHMAYIDLLVDTSFAEEYSAALYIPGKPELFPSVRED